MEIDITKFYNNAETRLYSNSVCNSGMSNIGEITWNSAKRANYSFINKDNRLEFLGHMRHCGMEDCLNMSIKEANGLFIQYISGDIQERKEAYDSWLEYQEASEKGICSGSLFKVFNKVYFKIDTSMYEGKTIQEIEAW